MGNHLRLLAEWLAATRLSTLFQDTLWVVPTSQSIHIVCLSVVFCSALMINLRLLGVGRSGRSVSELVTHLVPWMWYALVLLLLTGTVQAIAEPARQFVTPVFWIKMLLIVVVALMTRLFSRTVRRNAAAWDSASTRPAGAKWFAAASILIWIAIITCGRMIGYTYSYYS